MPNKRKKLSVIIAYHSNSRKGIKLAAKNPNKLPQKVRTMTTTALHDYIATFNNTPEIISLTIFKLKKTK